MNDFNRKTIAALAKNGVRIIGTQAAPGFEGDETFSGRNYCLDDNGCGIIRNHAQVLELAK